MDQDEHRARAAEILIEQRRSLIPIAPLPESLRPRDEGEGYLLQQTVKRLLAETGLGEAVGHKIGCTTPVMQAFLGIPAPCSGNVYARGVLRTSARVPRSGFIKLGIECEIAVQLAHDLAPQDAPFDRDSVARAVGGVMAAIEIVDDRYRDYRTLGAPTLIADDFFHSGCVLGEPVTDWQHLDLAALAGSMTIDGALVAGGTGGLVMGHPLNALAWLANSRARHRLEALRAGEFVLLGSLVETRWLSEGAQARVEIEHLGALELTIDRR
jgi:2-keto-4-pentenoate hydratase